MNTEIGTSLDIEGKSCFSHRVKAVACAFISSIGLIMMFIVIYFMMINLDNQEFILASVGPAIILLQIGAILFVGSAAASVWYMLKAIEDIVKK